MGYTNRAYPVVELGLSCQSMPTNASGSERKQEGDIVEARTPTAAIGFMEMARFLWVRVTGLEDAVVGVLCLPVEGYEKRRYRLPLERLAAVAPGVDVARARDTTDIYQPFLGVDADTGLFVWTAAPLDGQGLIYDTVTGEYL